MRPLDQNRRPCAITYVVLYKLLQERKQLTGDKDVDAQLQADLMERIEDVINHAIVDALPASQIDAFSSLMDEDNDAKTHQFLVKNIKDFDNFVALTIMKFREQYLFNR